MFVSNRRLSLFARRHEMTRPLPAKIGTIAAGMGRHDSEEDWDETREDSITPKGNPVSRVADKVNATPV